MIAENFLNNDNTLGIMDLTSLNATLKNNIHLDIYMRIHIFLSYIILLQYLL